jgi:hypothetical protein
VGVQGEERCHREYHPFNVQHSTITVTKHASFPTFHQRLEHVSPTAIHSLVPYQAIEGVQLIDNTSSTFLCNSCNYAKTMHKAIHPKHTALPTTAFSKKVHSDVWGPSPVHSLGGMCYYVTFTDDFNYFTWVLLLKTKDEVHGAYQTFTAWVHM